MGKGIAGIAGNSCPLCGELTPVPWVNIMFPRNNAFLCSVCKGWIRPAQRTRTFTFVGGFIGMGVAIWAYLQLLPRLQQTLSQPPPRPWLAALDVLLVLVMGFAGFFAVGTPFGRWNMELEPASRPRP
jgi:hypothetical protein